MKNKIVSYLTFVLVIIVMAVCVMMPEWLFKLNDNSLLKKSQVEEIDVPLTSENNGLTWGEKIKLLHVKDGLEVERGYNFDRQTIIAQTNNELEKFDREVLESRLAEHSELKLQTAGLVIDSNNPNLTMIIWVLYLIDEGGEEMGVVQLDDETGEILSLSTWKEMDITVDEGLARRLAAYQNAQLIAITEDSLKTMTTYNATFRQGESEYNYTLEKYEDSLWISPDYRKTDTPTIQTTEVLKVHEVEN